ncbi:DUF1295 domain-containing protein [uncultured Nocardioides sp.]|uniref:DUF1295 domain-containing protein n=1 Tax=uncultured Nocardioides sp. TaxID=198441 RepID=UPI0026918BF4
MTDTIPAPRSRSASLAIVTGLYVVAVAAAAAWLYLGPDTAYLWLDALIADLVATAVVFAGSRIVHNSSCYDAYWSVIPPLLAVYWWLEREPGADGVRFALLSVVLWLWAIRLTANWVYSWPGLHHEDWRYPMLREKNPKVELVVDLMGIHVFPTLQVFAAMLPVYAVTRSERAWGWLDLVALVVGVGAVLLQLVADTQQHRFARTKQPGESLVTGLWAWSRHPNYLGEILMWFSLLLFGLSALPGAWWWQVIGVVGMTAMFLGASIPMMEQRSLERRPGYQDVIDRVPMLLPRPPRRS